VGGARYDRVASRIDHRGPLDEATRRALDAERPRLAEVDRLRNGAVRAALGEFTRFELPDRVHSLMAGASTTVDGFTCPGADGRRDPDLVWPDDRRWFVATDVEFRSLFVAGTTAFTAEIAQCAPTSANPADLDDTLPIED